MNKQRSEKIAKIRTDLDQILSEEEDYFDNLSETAQEGEKGETSQNAIDALEEAISQLENITE